MKHSWFFWLVAVLVTVAALYYQRITGPTNPQRLHITLHTGTYRLSFPRSMPTEITPQQALGNWVQLDKRSTLNIKVKGFNGVAPLSEETPLFLYYKRAHSQYNWQMAQVTISAEGHIKATLPSQPPAGKLVYYIDLAGVTIPQEAPIEVRFRNNVPAYVLIPHILFMYAVMVLSTYGGLLALRNNHRWKRVTRLTLVALLIGGFILGPLVQKFAFGVYWSGWPLGEDLTDTKTLIAACFWVVALIFGSKKWGRILAIFAAIALLAIYSIPHSASGSHFNYETGRVETKR